MPSRFVNTQGFRSRVREAMTLRGLTTYRAFVEASNGALRASTVHAVLTGRTRWVLAATAQDMADTLGLTVEELTREPADTRRPWVLPEPFASVPEHVRPELEVAFASILRTAGLIGG